MFLKPWRGGMKATILVVDDDAVMIEILKGILGSQYIIETASNILDAIEMLKEIGSIRIIISDMEMLGGSGIDFFRATRHNRVWKTIPFILTSGKTNTGAVAARQEGMSGFIPKPFDDVPALREMISSLLAEGKQEGE